MLSQDNASIDESKLGSAGGLRSRDRARQASLLAVTAAGCALAALSFLQPQPRLIWNFSESIPTGLYRLDDGPWGTGELIAYRPSGDARRATDPVQGRLSRYGLRSPRPGGGRPDRRHPFCASRHAGSAGEGHRTAPLGPEHAAAPVERQRQRQRRFVSDAGHQRDSRLPGRAKHAPAGASRRREPRRGARTRPGDGSARPGPSPERLLFLRRTHGASRRQALELIGQ